jgi:hypothetical protein
VDVRAVSIIIVIPVVIVIPEVVIIPVGPVESVSIPGRVPRPVLPRVVEVRIAKVEGEREARPVPRIVVPVIVVEGVIVPPTMGPAVVVEVVVVSVGRRLAAGLLALVVPAVLTPVFVGIGFLAVHLLFMLPSIRLLVRDLELRVTAREAEGQSPKDEKQSCAA